MCVLSMVIDHTYDKWKDRYVTFPPGTFYPTVPTTTPQIVKVEPPITDQEIRDFRDLLARAKKYDTEHNQPDCELAEKKAKLQELADMLGVGELIFAEDTDAT